MLQVDQNIQRELSPLLIELFDWGDKLVTLTNVVTTPDLRTAIAWVSVLNTNNPEEVIKVLNKRSFDLYEQLAKRLKMKNTPKIEFKLDENEESIIRIDQIIEELKIDPNSNKSKMDR